MEVGLLGPVTIPVADGQVAPGKRARALLAVLALAGPEPLPTDELAQRLWAGTRPPDPASALDTLLGQLATALPDGAVLRDRHRPRPRPAPGDHGRRPLRRARRRGRDGACRRRDRRGRGTD